MDVSIKLLVTDKGVKVLGSEPDEDQVRQAVHEAVVYDGARALQICDILVPVTLLATPEPSRVEPKVVLQVSQDVREMVEAELQKRRMQDRELAWDFITNALSPGLYRISKGDGMRGMSREGD